MKPTYAIFLSLLLLGTANAQAPGESQAAKVLSGLISAVQANGYGSATDSANKALEDFLMDAGSRSPAFMRWNFQGLDTLGLQILTSDDRKFRIYCWDQYTGGTMHYYAAIGQYQIPGGKTAAFTLINTMSMEEGGSAGHWYSKIRTIKTTSGKTVYLAVYHGSGSSVDKTTGICAYTIFNGRLITEFPFFYTATQRFGKIDYYYSLNETIGFARNDIPGITLSVDRKTLTIPVVSEEGRVSKRTLVYTFDGEKFVYSTK